MRREDPTNLSLNKTASVRQQRRDYLSSMKGAHLLGYFALALLAQAILAAVVLYLAS